MKAILCHDYGPPDSLTLGELPDPEAGPGKAVIDIHAAGANFVDALCIQGTYQIKPPLPFIPGMELAGVVRAVGEGVGNVAPGDRVACLAGIGNKVHPRSAGQLLHPRLQILTIIIDQCIGTEFAAFRELFLT